MPFLAPSLLSANFMDLKSEIVVLNNSGISILHLDVMDGHYVPQISFGPSIIKQIRPLTKMFLDVHLMVDDPDQYIEQFVEAGADSLLVHYESSKHIHRTLQSIKKHKIKSGLVLNPGTPTEVLNYLIDEIDLVLIMSVNPGFGGQQFIPIIEQKIKEVHKIITEKNKDIMIEVDGGIKTHNAKDIIQAGADIIVSGSDVFGPDMESKIKQYNKIISDAEGALR